MRILIVCNPRHPSTVDSREHDGRQGIIAWIMAKLSWRFADCAPRLSFNLGISFSSYWLYLDLENIHIH